MIWKRIFGGRARDDEAYALYNALVAQARLPGFYLHAGVPDTLEGRFEMVMLHAFLVLHRLGQLGEPVRALGQRIFDILFDDMDQTLREMGVGDLSVGKKIKGLAAAFYGRIAAYDEALAADDGSVLERALTRNVFAAATPRAAEVTALADYVRASRALLAVERADAFLAGKVGFAPEPVQTERTLA